jgi:hypothetical protein
VGELEKNERIKVLDKKVVSRDRPFLVIQVSVC